VIVACDGCGEVAGTGERADAPEDWTVYAGLDGEVDICVCSLGCLAVRCGPSVRCTGICGRRWHCSVNVLACAVTSLLVDLSGQVKGYAGQATCERCMPAWRDCAGHGGCNPAAGAVCGSLWAGAYRPQAVAAHPGGLGQAPPRRGDSAWAG
jgi:hypothetical protein